MATAFLVHTRLSWGKTCDYLIANDVEPGLMHRYETREDWQGVILDALINVPLAPYLPSGQPIPPIGTAKVIGVEAVDPSQVKKKCATDTKSIYNGNHLEKAIGLKKL